MILPILAVWLLSRPPAELLRELSDEAIQVRERASAELYRRGEELRALLVETRDRTRDVETRGRLNEILSRLDADERIRRFGGANRVAGFAASLRSDWSYGAGPFRLSLEVMNVGERDQEFPGVAAWDVELPDQDVRGQGSEGRLSVKRFIGPSGLRRTVWAPREGGARAPAPLQPGESVRYEFVIEARSLPPGDYRIGVELFARELFPGAEDNLRSNSVSLTVRY